MGNVQERGDWLARRKAIDLLALFTVGEVRCVTQSRWWSGDALEKRNLVISPCLL